MKVTVTDGKNTIDIPGETTYMDPNKLRDPHDPVIPGEHVPSPEGHGGVSMPIGQSNPAFDPHEPVLPDGMKAIRSGAHRSNTSAAKRS